MASRRLLAMACTALALACLLPAAADAGAPLVLERTIALPRVAGRIDHMAVDLARKRLLVAELVNNSVDVIDLAEARPVHRIVGLSKPQGIAYAPAADAIVVANGGDGSVRLFHADGFGAIASIALGEDADDVALDARTGNVFVGYGSGGLAVIDPARRAVVATAALPAHPEAFRLDGRSGLVFANVPDARQIAVVDPAAARQVATWRVPGLRANFPMALDADGTALANVFRNPPTLVLLDAHSGRVLAQRPTCGDADDVFFDRPRRRLYVSCGAGAVDVVQRDGDALHPLARVTTVAGARTSLFVPELDRLFVAARAGIMGGRAAILVFRPDG